MKRLQDKVCLITGTGGSMGRAAALLFAQQGAKIVGCDIDMDAARATQNEVIAEGGEMVSLEPCDLTNIDECDSLKSLAVNSFGRIDVLFNNAAKAYFDWIDQMSISVWDKTINEELNLVFLLTRTVWPELIKSRGVIVNTASVSAWHAAPGLPGLAHCAAKGAVLSLTRQLAMEGAPHGIRANSISPGFIATKQTKWIVDDGDALKVMTDEIMLGRAGRPEEVAAAALFLASGESSFITGADLRVDGGTGSW